MILNSIRITANEYVYEFSWLGIPTSKLIINIEDKDNNASENSSFSISTIGPLKLYRNYTSSGLIKLNKEGWSLYIEGLDRGQREEKHIQYSLGSHPIVKVFVDDKGVTAIEADPILDKNSVDAFTVFLKTVKSLRDHRDCSNRFNVFDGKRRYVVNINTENINENNGSFTIKCSFGMNRLKTINMESHGTNSENWPFKQDNQFIIINFSEKSNFLPEYFVIMTPIGKIRGQLQR